MLELKAILNSQNIYLYGVIDYALVQPHLLNNNAKKRLNNNINSLIIVALPYKVNDIKNRNLSYYACVADYHNVLGDKLNKICKQLSLLHINEDFQSFVDNSPFPEVECAITAGLGKRGDNNLLITKEYGSYVFIGCIATSLNLATCNFPKITCHHCGKCSSVCPAKVLPNFTADKCLSAITQKKGMLNKAETELVLQNNTVWGCDICQLVCPCNDTAKNTTETAFTESLQSHYSPNKFNDKYPYAWRGADTINRNYYIINKVPTKK